MRTKFLLSLLIGWAGTSFAGDWSVVHPELVPVKTLTSTREMMVFGGKLPNAYFRKRKTNPGKIDTIHFPGAHAGLTIRDSCVVANLGTTTFWDCGDTSRIPYAPGFTASEISRFAGGVVGFKYGHFCWVSKSGAVRDLGQPVNSYGRLASDDSLIYAYTPFGYFFQRLRASDSTWKWSDIPELQNEVGHIVAILDGKVFGEVGKSPGDFYYSGDLGRTYTLKSVNITPGGMSDLTYSNGVIFAGFHGITESMASNNNLRGIRTSIDSGATWTPILNDSVVVKLAIFDDTLFAITDHGSLLAKEIRSKTTGLALGVKRQDAPAWEQVGRTLTNKGRPIQLSVFNTTGQRVANFCFQPHQRAVLDLAPGLYSVREDGNNAERGRIVLP